MSKFLLALVFAFTCSLSMATTKDKEIVLWVPYGPGGISGKTAVGLQNVLKEKHPGPVIVRYQPGADGILGINKWSETDNSSINLLVTNDRIPISVYLAKNLPADLEKKIKTLAFLGYSPYIVHGSKNLPISDLRDLDKSKKDHLTFGYQGRGSFGHLVYLTLQRNFKTNITLVPYPGSAKTLTDLAGGHIDLAIGFPADSLQFANEGMSKPLAASTEIADLKVPYKTLKQQGITGAPIGSFFAVFAKSDMPRSEQDYVQKLLTESFATPEASVAWQQSQKLTAPAADPVAVERWWTGKTDYYKSLAKDPRFETMQAQ